MTNKNYIKARKEEMRKECSCVEVEPTYLDWLKMWLFGGLMVALAVTTFVGGISTFNILKGEYKDYRHSQKWALFQDKIDSYDVCYIISEYRDSSRTNPISAEYKCGDLRDKSDIGDKSERDPLIAEYDTNGTVIKWGSSY